MPFLFLWCSRGWQWLSIVLRYTWEDHRGYARDGYIEKFAMLISTDLLFYRSCFVQYIEKFAMLISTVLLFVSINSCPDVFSIDFHGAVSSDWDAPVQSPHILYWHTYMCNSKLSILKMMPLEFKIIRVYVYNGLLLHKMIPINAYACMYMCNALDTIKMMPMNVNACVTRE